MCRPALAPSRLRYSYGARCIPVLEAAEFFAECRLQNPYFATVHYLEDCTCKEE
jgi:hypothetical protein